jgi:hypothetical protein
MEATDTLRLLDEVEDIIKILQNSKEFRSR